MAQAHPLSVVTFNVWGLMLLSKQREQRIKYLAEWLKTCDADVVMLQEVWVDSDAQLLMAAGKAAGLAHGVHFRSGMFGSGLVTMARHAITQMAFWAFAASGISHALHTGDFFAGKGVGWVRLQAPFGEVDVLNTHMHANYSHEFEELPRDMRINPMYDAELRVPADDNACYRVAQVLDLAQLAALVSGTSLGASPTSTPNRSLILAGDLNCEPGTLEMQLLRLLAPRLRDAWATSPDDARSGGMNGANPEGLTCHVPGNTFQPRRQVPERIDYVWSDWACSRAEVILTERTLGGTSYSDHYGVRVTLEQPAGAATAVPPAAPAAAPAKSLFGLAKSVVSSSAAPTTGPAAAPAAAEAAGAGRLLSAANAAGLSDATARTVLVRAATLLEDGVKCCSADVSLKSAAGAFMCALVVYSAIALPYFLPDVEFSGLWLGMVLVLAGLLGAVGALMFVAARLGDKGQMRALLNAHKQLRVFVAAQGVELAAAGAQLQGREGSGGSGTSSGAARTKAE